MRAAALLLAVSFAAPLYADEGRGITDSAEGTYDKAADLTTLTITLAKNGAGFRFQTRWKGKPFEAVAQHQKLSGWKDKYFFVRDDCLAPADKALWRCVREHVFTLTEGDSKLAYLGAVYAGEDCIEDKKFGCSLYEDVFTDTYDVLEKNSLATHDDSPALLLELRAADGAFRADLDETWGRNQERYRAGTKCLAASTEERKEQCVEGINPLRALLFNLTLARYTKHDEAYTATRAQAKDVLCTRASDDCSEALQSLNRLMETVKPGELPKSDDRVKAITAPAK